MLISVMLCVLCGAIGFAACDEHEHSFENYVYNNDATCFADGTETATCSCGEKDTRTKQGTALGHEYQDGFCIRCQEQEPSDGLLYVPTMGWEGYMVASVGTCSDEDIVIASVYNKLPVTEIGEKAFYGIESITSVKMPDSIVKIGAQAFFRCRGLTSIDIPDSVTSIGDFAFSGCSGLTSVIIPDSVTSIENDTFNGCHGLKSITIGSGVTTIGKYAFWGCRELKSVTIGSGVTTIGESAFLECSGLTSIVIPDNVTTIVAGAFYFCSGLESVTIGSGLTSIGGSAFAGCRELQSVIWNAENCTPEEGLLFDPAFCDCPNLSSVTFGDQVKIVPANVFNGCSGLESVTIGSGVTLIESGAFEDCDNLQSAAFRAPTGWSCNGAEIAPAVLQNPATAAAHLSKTYCEYDWVKEEYIELT